MTLRKHLTPSIVYKDVKDNAKRIKRRKGVEVVPMLVVEGKDDEEVFADFCKLTRDQVMCVGDRNMVEGVMREFRRELPSFLQLAGLTDCDAVGKVPDLITDRALVVTQGCDLEADFFLIGVVERALGALNVRAPGDLAARAMDMSVPISALRRGAHAVEGLSMKIPSRGQKRQFLRFARLDDQAIEACASAEFEDALDAVSRACAELLGWSQEERSAATAATPRDGVTFETVGSGKDAFDALLFLLRSSPKPNTLDDPRRVERSARQLTATDFADWHVGRRLTSWQDATGVELLGLAVESPARR